MPERVAIWTPEDTAQLAADIAAFPREVGESVVLDEIMQAEGVGS